MAKVTCVQCPECLDIIYSRAHHDFHYCTCGKLAIDGGQEYMKISGGNKKLKIFHKIIKTTWENLYLDWAKQINKYGIIKTNKKV